MSAKATPVLETMTIRCATVSPTLLDVDWFEGQGVPCCQCGANMTCDALRMSDDAIRRRDVRGEYVECDACGMRHYAQGGRFLFHGDRRTRLEYWCSTCTTWRLGASNGTHCDVCGRRLRRN